jgi:lysozyme family protein
MTRDDGAAWVIALVLSWEGGIADVGDGKGVTRWGQTPQWLAQFGFEPPKTRDQAVANYRTWLVRTRLIGLCDYPDTLALAVIDWAVSSGHAEAIRGLQRALGTAVDGIYGPETQDLVDRLDSCPGARSRQSVAARVLAARMRFIGRLVTDKPTNARFAAGWNDRLADQVERLAIT